MPDRVATEPQNRSEAGSAGSASAGVSDSGKYREVRLERHLGEIAEPLSMRLQNLDFYSIGCVSYRLAYLSTYLYLHFSLNPQHLRGGGIPFFAEH